MPRLAALSGRGLAHATDRDLYNFALAYAQGHQMGTPTGVVGAGTAIGAPRFATSARLELARQSGPDAFTRRRVLAASLARRTTEASRRRALNRILAGYGATV